MAGRNVSPPVAFTGGVALVPGMSRALEAAIGQGVSIAPEPQLTGALGAAILACRRIPDYSSVPGELTNNPAV
jgi:activator of 2-hydroxyglutaryl-CoA dehydratase